MVSSPGTNNAEAYHSWADLRDVLFNLVSKGQQWVKVPSVLFSLVDINLYLLSANGQQWPLYSSPWPSTDPSLAVLPPAPPFLV